MRATNIKAQDQPYLATPSRDAKGDPHRTNPSLWQLRQPGAEGEKREA